MRLLSGNMLAMSYKRRLKKYSQSSPAQQELNVRVLSFQVEKQTKLPTAPPEGAAR